MSYVIGAKVLTLGESGDQVLPFGFESVIAGAIMLVGAHMMVFPKWHIRLYYSWRGAEDDELDAFLTRPRIVGRIVGGLLVFAVGLATLIVTGIEGPTEG